MEQLITAYYNAILRVDPTPAQIQLWLNLIDPNNPDPGIEDLADALCFQSPETISLMKIYQVVLGRVPDSGGLDFWVQVFRDIREANPELTYEQALVATIRDWLESEEFTDVYGTELSVEEYVSLLYINILNRPPDQAGFDFWVNEVKTGVITREELVIAFSESAEFASMVDAEAKGILLYDAQISSDFAGDDPEHRVENDDPYGGELQNEAPLDILIGTDVDENSAEDVEVNDGQLTVVDPDAGDSHTWMLVDDADGAFKLDDPNAQSPKIIVADSSKLDHETADMLYVTVRVTDSRGETLEKTFPIDINDINEEPYNLDLSNMTIDEQDGSVSNPGAAGALVGLLTADDVDDGAFGDLTFSTNDPRFSIVNGNELRVADPAAFDAENGVSSVDVVVRVTDGGGLYEEKTFTIDVTPIVDEDPTDVLPDTLNVSANTPAGLSLVELVAVDPDTSPDSHTFQITNDPTDQGGGGAFAMDITGTKLVLADPTKINSTNLVDNGPVDTDGVLNGLIVFELDILATDSNGNTYPDKIQVTVDQNGLIIPFTDTIVEVLDGSNGDDVFTAQAGLGWDGPVPGFNQTANAGDIANGMGGNDLFVLTKADDNFDDGSQLVTGVTLNDIEGILLINEDQSPAPVLGQDPWDGPGGPILFDFLGTIDVCTPCINLPPIAPVFDNPLIFDASLAADVDTVGMGQSRGSIGVWDLQSDFWVAAENDENDLGPVWDIFDMTAALAWLDSDPQAKQFEDNDVDGKDDGELVVTLDEARLNELRITENASGNEPGFGPREEQLGTISLKASGVPSIIGSINNGWQGPAPTLPGWLPIPVWPTALGTTTHTLNIDVANLTGTTPTSAVGTAAAAANTAAIDFFAGQASGIGNGLLGLQNVNIAGPIVNGVQQPAGDVFLIFGVAANDIDTDGDGASLEIMDGEGSSFFFFEEDGFGAGDDGTAVRIDGGDGYDTVGVFASDLASFGGDTNFITNVERLKVLDTASGTLYLDPFNDDLQTIVLAGGVSGNLSIRNIPDLSQEGATTQQNLLCDDFGVEGFVVEIDQCCYDDPNNPTGDLPANFRLFLDADGGGTARVATIFNVDPGNAVGDGVVTVDNLRLQQIHTFHLNVTDCDNATDGLFEVRYLGDNFEDDLQTLLITSNSGTNGGGDITKILQDPSFDITAGTDDTTALTLVKGTGDARHQHFLEFDPGQLADVKMLAIAEDWGDDTNNNRPSGLDRKAEPANIINELTVSYGGAVVDLGEGNDIFTGNRSAGAGADFIRGNGGNDLLFGADGNDQIEGGSGDDEIQGEGGDDCLFGDSGDDLILAGSGNDFADGGADDDIIFGASGNDHLRGGTGDDFICGGDDDDSLYGEDGDDLLIGGEGDDFLDAGASGNDMLVGDYNCEPCYVTVEIQDANDTDPIEECDVFDLTIDGDGFRVEVGTGPRSFVCEAEVEITGGTLRVTINGVNYDEAFAGDAATTLANWVTSHGGAVAGLGQGITVEQSLDGNSLIFTDVSLPSDPAYIPSTSVLGVGNGVVTEQKYEKIFTNIATADGVAAAFETLIEDWISGDSPTTLMSGDPTCWDVQRVGDVLTICKVDEYPEVTFAGVDAAIPSVHKSELDGQIGDGDDADQTGDSFTWDVTWSGGNQVYTFTFDQEEHNVGTNLAAVLSADNIVDTIAELRALSQDIVDDFNNDNNIDTSNDAAAAALRAAGFSMELDADGKICLIGPDDKTGETPTVLVSSLDGGGAEIPAIAGQECIDIDETQTFQAGDEVTVGIDTNLDGVADILADVTVADVNGGGVDATDVAQQLAARLNGVAGGVVDAIVDINDLTKVIVTADVAGVAGDFDLIGPNAAEAEVFLARTTELDTVAADFEAGETLTIFIDDDDSIPTSYSIVHTGVLATTLANFVTAHGANILAEHGVEVRVNGSDDRLEFYDPNGNTADAGLTFGVPTISGVGDGGSVAMELQGTADVQDQVCAWDITINAGETLDVIVDGVLYSTPFNTNASDTIDDFITAHAGALGPHMVPSNGGGGTIVFTDFVGVLAAHTIDSVMVNGGGGGSAVVNAVVTSKTLFDPGDIVGEIVGVDAMQDDTQSLDFVDQTAGTPPQDLTTLDDNVNEVDKTEPDQDVFVATARTNDMTAFANNGYDNDDRPDHDFHGLLDAAGLATGDGADAGVDGVVYVMDFNQGGGGDNIYTFDQNEAYNQAENTTVDGRFHTDLWNAFGNDADRLQGDKVSFRKSSDGLLDECGTTFNFDEEQDQSVDRDDSDANAVNAFNSNSFLKYYVVARSFEDALFDNHGLIWGADVDQADVDAAVADLADGSDDNDVGGIWSSSADLLQTMKEADGESWLRVYYNEAGTDGAPEAVMELVGLDSTSQFSFKDIVGADCIDEDHVLAKTPVDIWDQL